MRLPRYVEPLFAEAFLETLDIELAATKIGIRISPRHFGNALMKRPTVRALIDKLKQERCERLRMDADQVLSELVRQYARLMHNSDNSTYFEREIRETLKAVGEHVNVAAYGKNSSVQPAPVSITIVHVGGSEPQRLPGSNPGPMGLVGESLERSSGRNTQGQQIIDIEI